MVGGAIGGDTHTAMHRVKERKEHLSKQAKRRRADRVSEWERARRVNSRWQRLLNTYISDTKGERPRGWDWVDVIKVSEIVWCVHVAFTIKWSVLIVILKCSKLAFFPPNCYGHCSTVKHVSEQEMGKASGHLTCAYFFIVEQDRKFMNYRASLLAPLSPLVTRPLVDMEEDNRFLYYKFTTVE